MGEKASVEHDLVLVADGAIAGVVVDRDGHPRAGVKMILSCRDGYPGTVTASDGTFRYDDIPIGEVDVMADLDIENVRQTTTVRSNATSDVRFVIDKGSAVVSGVVLDELGRPAPDVLVTMWREGRSPGWSVNKFETGTDGHFAFGSLPDGMYKLEASRGGTPTASVEHVAAGTVTTIRFEATSSIAGHVRGTDGNPLTDFTISVTAGDKDVRSERFFRNGGRYHLDDLPPGSFDLAVVSASGEGHLAIELGKGERHDNVDLTIDASLVVTGRVLDLVSHQPIAGVSVYAHVQGPGRGQRATTNSDGHFTITGLAHGPLSVDVYQPTFTSSELKRPSPDGSSVDVGDIAIMRDRYAGQSVGTLGLAISEDRTIHAFESDSSGLKAGLVVGDVVTSIDGIDVTSATGGVVYVLTLAPIGTTIHIGVARGVTIAAVTAK